jgi:hypothetical protein
MHEIDAIETVKFTQPATAADRLLRLLREPAARPRPLQKDDEGSLVVLEILQLSIATGGVDRSDFERYGQAIGEDLGGWVGLKNTGRELGRDIGGLLWENPSVAGGTVGAVRGGGLTEGAKGGIVGAAAGGGLRGRAGGLFGGGVGAIFGFGLGRIFR